MIKLIIFDVDGVMTDGTITYDSEGREYKSFNVKDGYAVVTAIKKGIKVAVITSRFSPMVEKRCKELGIEDIFQGVDNKLKSYEILKAKYGLQDREIAAMGDDIPDLPILERVGISGAPKDAVEVVKKKVKFVSSFPGGKGAVRDFIEYLLGGIE
ncbi:3-deoxy-D-manno-octulosonate 8-phosphate phosphatase, YrbI family [Desulfurobacterium thermolithotrophum DSM 11699]|uniref:3-deoxy-D-manno-octulosonate 8-phosphate phosphatase, YrbI family n=1 Tax=Desulfurobacterium thermolithotrophum (strain DSM 11699 / BSA) TaxID=868864 RepID=F0S0C7_DESTD|nr:HAD-IIIA family hydrolase [Desulfurobacterium thermolithotrophum]ADY73806.1 3-deoxy-D-manno-octulosonate 8-phosphate phosphatase, YrbI family [Desulfurobacterium thermolithotrophum DSM 11699]